MSVNGRHFLNRLEDTPVRPSVALLPALRTIMPSGELLKMPFGMPFRFERECKGAQAAVPT